MASARIDGFDRPPLPSSPLPSSRTSPSPTSTASSAMVAALTTAARTLASSPSGMAGNSRKRCAVTTTPSTASPRNSSRSFDSRPPFSAHHDRCVSASSSSSRSSNGQPRRSAKRRRASVFRGSAQPADHVVDRVAHRLQILEILVLDAEADAALAELLFEGLDQLDRAPASRRRGRRRRNRPRGWWTDRSRGCRPGGRGSARRPRRGRSAPARRGSLRAPELGLLRCRNGRADGTAPEPPYQIGPLCTREHIENGQVRGYVWLSTPT